MTLYRTKPSQVEAIDPYTTHLVALEMFVTHGTFSKLRPVGPNGSNLELLAGKDGAQGWVPVPLGHLIVRNPGDPTDLWTVASDYFDRKYEPVEDA